MGNGRSPNAVGTNFSGLLGARVFYSPGDAIILVPGAVW
jgi:hypothetical protein